LTFSCLRSRILPKSSALSGYILRVTESRTKGASGQCLAALCASLGSQIDSWDDLTRVRGIDSPQSIARDRDSAESPVGSNPSAAHRDDGEANQRPPHFSQGLVNMDGYQGGYA